MLSREGVSRALAFLGVTGAGSDASLNAMLDGAGFGAQLGVDEFVRVVRRLADEQSMRKQRPHASGLTVGPTDVLSSTFNKKMLQA